MDFPEPVVSVSVEPVSKGTRILYLNPSNLVKKIQPLKSLLMKRQVKQLFLEWVNCI